METNNPSNHANINFSSNKNLSIPPNYDHAHNTPINNVVKAELNEYL